MKGKASHGRQRLQKLSDPESSASYLEVKWAAEDEKDAEINRKGMLQTYYTADH